MTIAETDKQIRGVIKQWHVYGAEAIVNALVRACEHEPYLQRDDLLRLLDHAYINVDRQRKAAEWMLERSK